MECTLVREQDLHQPEYVYLPDILKDGYVRHRHFPADTPGSIVSIFWIVLVFSWATKLFKSFS